MKFWAVFLLVRRWNDFTSNHMIHVTHSCPNLPSMTLNQALCDPYSVVSQYVEDVAQ